MSANRHPLKPHEPPPRTVVTRTHPSTGWTYTATLQLGEVVELVLTPDLNELTNDYVLHARTDQMLGGRLLACRSAHERTSITAFADAVSYWFTAMFGAKPAPGFSASLQYQALLWAALFCRDDAERPAVPHAEISDPAQRAMDQSLP